MDVYTRMMEAEKTPFWKGSWGTTDFNIMREGTFGKPPVFSA